jgi:DNA-binding NtrC family response regulator
VRLITAFAEPPVAERKVLVVDDEPNIVRVVTRILEAAGYKVLEAQTSGQGAVLLKREGPVDCVLLDYSLEGESCSDAWASLAIAQPGVPIVIQSGFSQADVAAGMSEFVLCAGYLKKPFGMEQLITAVAKACDSSEVDQHEPVGGLRLGA